jgi:glutaredoxin
MNTFQIKCLTIAALVFVIALFFVIMTIPAVGDIYTWSDENGVKHFSNEPPPDIETVEQQAEIKHDAAQYKQWDEERKAQLDKITDNEPSGDSVEREKAPPGAKEIPAPGEVVIFTTPTCGYCKRAKAFFAKHNVAYTEYDIAADPQAKKRFRELKGKGVPLIYIGKERVVGFNQSRLQRLLGIRG